jgi:hypothetical protein
MGNAGSFVVRHSNAAEAEQDDEHNSAREAAVGDVEVRELPQVNEVDDGATADARCSQQPVTQIPDSSCQHQAERYCPARRVQPGRPNDDHHGSRHRDTREQYGRGWPETEGGTGVPGDIDGQDPADYLDWGLTLPGRCYENFGHLVKPDTRQCGPDKHRRAARVHRHQSSMASHA